MTRATFLVEQHSYRISNLLILVVFLKANKQETTRSYININAILLKKMYSPKYRFIIKLAEMLNQ